MKIVVFVIPLVIPNTNSKKVSKNKEVKRSYSMGWAKRLKRVFGIDIQICSNCGGQLKIISAIEEMQLIQKILTHRGENSKIPKLFSPRGPPETDDDFSTS